MKNTKVIIGANFGDEGKGLITDYFTSQNAIPNSTIVVRFNGGAQCGHTVTLENGSRHVFGHFGSGSLSGALTYLSEFMVVNPYLFLKEIYPFVKKFRTAPVVFVDENCIISTPFDVLLNQINETVKGDNRHGSCGIGFNETIYRNSYPEFGFSVKDWIKKEWEVQDKLINIKEEYFPQRLKVFGISNDEVPNEYKPLIKNPDKLISKFLSDLENFLETTVVTDIGILTLFDSVIFEGGQGLLLDEESRFFPHVTRSKTGIHNVLKLIERSNTPEEAEVVYVSRCYLTRHGAGPLPGEIEGLPYSKVSDKTNVENTYQGKLRYAYFDADLTLKSIAKDQAKVPSYFKKSLAITCLDQVDDRVKFKIENTNSLKVEDFLGFLAYTLKPDKLYHSYGPFRSHIKKEDCDV